MVSCLFASAMLLQMVTPPVAQCDAIANGYSTRPKESAGWLIAMPLQMVTPPKSTGSAFGSPGMGW